MVYLYNTENFYSVQVGSRNTQKNSAKLHVCMHKWADTTNDFWNVRNTIGGGGGLSAFRGNRKRLMKQPEHV